MVIRRGGWWIVGDAGPGTVVNPQYARLWHAPTVGVAPLFHRPASRHPLPGMRNDNVVGVLGTRPDLGRVSGQCRRRAAGIVGDRRSALAAGFSVPGTLVGVDSHRTSRPARGYRDVCRDHGRLVRSTLNDVTTPRTTGARGAESRYLANSCFFSIATATRKFHASGGEWLAGGVGLYVAGAG